MTLIRLEFEWGSDAFYQSLSPSVSAGTQNFAQLESLDVSQQRRLCHHLSRFPSLLHLATISAVRERNTIGMRRS